MSQAHAVNPVLSKAEASLPEGHGLRRLFPIGIAFAVIGLAGTGVLASSDMSRFYLAWLYAFAFGLSIGLGALLFVVIQHATMAGWSAPLRRVAEHIGATLPIFALLFIPIAFGLHSLYHWSHADAVASDKILQGKAVFLNEPFFYARAAIYFTIWTFLSFLFRSRSMKHDETGDFKITKSMQRMSYPAIPLLGLSLSFAAFDWLMSLDPHWYSTIFGVYYFAGSSMAALAVLSLVAASLHTTPQFKPYVTVEHLHDVGKLLFGFNAFWTYIAFSQYFLIWYANIPEETLFFLRRQESGWVNISLLLMFGHFFFAFWFMMSRHMKRNPLTLSIGAFFLLAMHAADMYWLVMPVPGHGGELVHAYHFAPIDVTALLAVVGVFMAAFGYLLNKGPVLPLRDPRMKEALSYENI